MYQPGERNDEEDAKPDEDMDLLRGGCIDQVRVGIRLFAVFALAPVATKAIMAATINVFFINFSLFKLLIMLYSFSLGWGI